jgi:hypothetical protein
MRPIDTSFNFAGDIVDLFVSMTKAKENVKTAVAVERAQSEMDNSLLNMGHNGTVDTYL